MNPVLPNMLVESTVLAPALVPKNILGESLILTPAPALVNTPNKWPAKSLALSQQTCLLKSRHWLGEGEQILTA